MSHIPTAHVLKPTTDRININNGKPFEDNEDKEFDGIQIHTNNNDNSRTYDEHVKRINELKEAVKKAKDENIRLTVRYEMRNEDYQKLLLADRQNLVNIINQVSEENTKLRGQQKS